MTNAYRDPLDFVATTRKAFRFLEDDYGFAPVRQTPELVRYERGPVFVNVIREVGVNALIGRKLRLRDGPRGLWRQLRHEWGTEFPVEYLDNDGQLNPVGKLVSDATDVQRDVEHLANLVRHRAHALLIGNDDAYRKIGKLGRQRSRELTDWATGKSPGS